MREEYRTFRQGGTVLFRMEKKTKKEKQITENYERN